MLFIWHECRKVVRLINPGNFNVSTAIPRCGRSRLVEQRGEVRPQDVEVVAVEERVGRDRGWHYVIPLMAHRPLFSLV